MSKKKVKYLNAELMFHIMQSEYNNELERKKDIDSKATTFIAANIAILTVFIPLIPFSDFEKLWINASCLERIVVASGFLGLIVSAILMGGSFIVLVKAATVREYQHVNIDALNVIAVSEEKDNDDVSITYAELTDHYYGMLQGDITLKGNLQINNKRAKLVGYGICMSTIGYIILLFFTVGFRIAI